MFQRFWIGLFVASMFMTHRACAAPVPVSGASFAGEEVARLVARMRKERLVTFTSAGTLMLANPSSEITDKLEALGDTAVEPLAQSFAAAKSDSERYGIGVALAARGPAGDRALVRLLRTPGLKGRRWLLQGLGGKFTRGVVTALRELVRDPDRELAERAVLDLAESEDDAGVVILRGVLRSPERTLRQRAALALAFHNDATGVDLLLEDLRDAHGGALALFQTMKGLGVSGSPKAVAPLAQMFAANSGRIEADEPPGRVSGLSDFEARFRQMPVSERAMLLATHAASALAQLSVRGPRPEIVALVTHANPQVRRMALEVLGACGDASAAPAVLGVLADGMARARADASGHRGELGAVETGEASGAEAELIAAAQALRGIASPAISKELNALYRRAKMPLSGWIALALAAVNDPAGVARAVQLAHGENDLAIAALGTLGRSSAPEAVEFLTGLMETGEAPMQLVAASALSQPGHARAVRPLEALLARGREANDPQRMAVAALGLGLAGDRTAVKDLEELVRNPSAAVRRSAVVGLYYLTGEARRYVNAWDEEGRFEPTTFHLKMRQETTRKTD